MDHETMEAGTKKRDVLLPASIVIAGVLVAGAVIWSVGKGAGNAPAGPSAAATPDGPDIASLRPVDANDHIQGPRDAAVTVVEYSDFECPFCKRFDATMKSVLASHEGQVAWVYRQYPIEGLHTKAPKESEASECVTSLGGNDAFWKFADRIFEVTPSNDGLDPATLPDIAEYAGVARGAFESCLSSGQFAASVSASVKEAEDLGIHGTPYIVFVAKKAFNEGDFSFLEDINTQFAAQYPGQPVPFAIDAASRRIGMSGAFPVELVEQIVTALL